jgi:23S rRNA (adenine2030-N6)-methyltransferase
MAYIHYGRIGDVWKHLPLCAFLRNEGARFYIESNCAFPVYPLTRSIERDYGIYTFMKNAAASSVLSGSEYYETVRSVNANRRDLDMYPGSPGLAFHILKDSVERYLLCDIENKALADIRHYAASMRSWRPSARLQ